MVVLNKNDSWFHTHPSLKTHPYVFLWVSSIHPAHAPSLTITPSLRILPPPPPPSFNPKLNCQTGGTTSGKPSMTFFWSSFPLFLLVVTIYHWIELFLSINIAVNLWYLLFKYFVRIKENVLVQPHLCHCHFNITVEHLSPTTTLLVLVY